EGVAGRRDRPPGEDGAVLEQEVAPPHAATPAVARENATRPAATVVTTRPVNRAPRHQLLAERERRSSAVTVHSASRSSSTRLARSPTARRGTGRPNTRAGPTDIRSSSVASGSTPGRTRLVWSAAKAVSSPITPNGASSNGAS